VATEKIKVLIADDSPVVREIIKDMIADVSDLEVVGEAKHGREAVTLAESMKPDIITMDVMMPVMNGLEAVEEIMAYSPTPILVFSSVLDNKEMDVAFNAIARGALDVMEKPKVSEGESYDRIQTELLDKLRMLSKIHVIPHLRGKRKKARREFESQVAVEHEQERNTPAPIPRKTQIKEDVADKIAIEQEATEEFTESAPVEAPKRSRVKKKLVAVGASTGGPKALVQIFRNMPKDFPLPVLTVQHIAPSFARGLVNWLNRESPMRVVLAEDKIQAKPGTVHIAPSGTHLILQRGLIRLSDTPPVNSCRPSVDVLFFSVAESIGEFSLGVLLTGMGRDGAEGLKAIKNSRGRTLVQDEKTSVIFGMPKAALDIGAADEVVELGEIPRAIARAIVK